MKSDNNQSLVNVDIPKDPGSLNFYDTKNGDHFQIEHNEIFNSWKFSGKIELTTLSELEAIYSYLKQTFEFHDYKPSENNLEQSSN
jgi:hypothetical protein